MIDFYVTDQTIRFASPVIAANSRDYLTARFHFSGEDWEGCSKWAHFRQGETVYDLNLENDEISSGMHLNLSVGQWEVYLTGQREETRITTVPVLLQVRESGLIDEPLHQIPLSVAEQVDSKANLALEKAREIEEKLESGALDGKNFQIIGYYESLEALMEAVKQPERGDTYGVGTEIPYLIYVYDGLNDQWVNNGSIQGPRGDDGETGATFSPQIDGGGNLSWVNDKGLPNPPTVNLRGDKGEKGDKGDDGESPYALAVKEGFSGTEATFNWSLAHVAGHADQHKAGGTDPLEVETDSIKAGAVTRGKLAADVKVLSFTNKPVAVSDWVSDTTYGDFPYRAAVVCDGVTDRHYAQVVFSPEDATSGSFAPVAASYPDGVYVYASKKPSAAVTIPTIICTPVA